MNRFMPNFEMVRSKMKYQTFTFASIIGLFLASPALATSLNLGTDTNAGAWVVTGGGAVNAPALQHTIGISITSNGFSTGTFATGGSAANFNGFWMADNYFTLPADAQGATFVFSGLYADDRVVAELNGAIIGNFFLDSGSISKIGAGLMAFPPGPPDVSYSFTGVVSGTDTNHLNLGGVNDLRLILNNTGGPSTLTSPTVTFRDSGDAVHTRITASVTYTQPAPEPGSLLLLGLGAIGLLVRQRSGYRAAWFSVI